MLFEDFGKLPRLTRECVITEKIDGTNAQILIIPTEDLDPSVEDKVIARKWNLVMLAGSRNRYITPKDDNYGFAGWAERNADELFLLNVGRHFGEWWGNGIQRGYGLKEKKFSLFNVGRFTKGEPREKQIKIPPCCDLVPVIYSGVFLGDCPDRALDSLAFYGSMAAPGFMDPEGIIIYHEASKVSFKKTLKNDESPKSRVK